MTANIIATRRAVRGGSRGRPRPARSIIVDQRRGLRRPEDVRPGRLDDCSAANSDEIFHQFQVWRLLTATFLHDGPWHILMNMLFLWMVGREMESFYGTPRLRGVVHLGGRRQHALLGGRRHLRAPRGLRAPWSGPRARSWPWWSCTPSITRAAKSCSCSSSRSRCGSSWSSISAYNLLQFLSPNNGDRRGLCRPPRRRGVRLPLQGGRPPALPARDDVPPEAPAPDRPGRAPRVGLAVPPVDRPHLVARAPPSSTRPSPTAVIPEEQFDEKLDEILVKIAREGRGSLSEDENRVLEEASRRARNRRSERI